MWDHPEPLRLALGRDEELLWSGQPRRGLQFRGSDAFLIPFSLLWCGFVIVWELMALGIGGVFPFVNLFVALWGLPFLLVGLYLLVGRFVHDAMRRARTYYGLTNRRVLIATDFLGRRLTSIELASLGTLSLSERSDGSGTIAFDSYPANASWFGQAWTGSRQVPPLSLELVENARAVHDRILEARRALRRGSESG